MSLSLSLSLSWMMDLYALCFEGDCEQKGSCSAKSCRRHAPSKTIYPAVAQAVPAHIKITL